MKRFYKLLLIFIVSFFIFFLLNKNLKINRNLYFMEKSNIISFIRDYKKIILENKQLKNSLIDYENIKSKNIECEEEINNLQGLLDLKRIYTNYHMVYSTVISLDKMYFQNIFMIDKGKKDSISVNDAVIGTKGLIGIITTIYDNSSIVKLLNNDVNNISVKIKAKDKDVFGSLEGYNNEYYLVKGTTNYDSVSISDKVYTTGLGNLPSGIYVGSVKEIKQDNYGISNILYIDNEENINNVRYVAVLVNNK